MKRKVTTITLAVICGLSLTACNGNSPSQGTATTQESTQQTASLDEMSEGTAAETTEETDTSAATDTAQGTSQTDETASDTAASSTPAELSDDIYSFQISIDSTVYQFPMWAADFEASGWTYEGSSADAELSSNEYSVAEAWSKNGLTVYTQMANLSMNTVALTDAMVAGIEFDRFLLEDTNCEIRLPKDILLFQSTKEDILAAYGDPSDVYEGDLYTKLTYEKDFYQEISLFVYKESGVLEEIELENMVELEGADNSVDPTVPDIVNSYAAPSAVGDDLYQFHIELEGNLYTLPCPVSALLANGFALGENSAESVAAGGFDWVELTYNNESYRCIVENYADYATIPENCFVTTMKSSINGPDFAMTIPCNIKRGDSEETLQQTLEGFHYETETSSDLTYYTVYNPEGSSLDSFVIIVKDGQVAIIEASNDTKPE